MENLLSNSLATFNLENGVAYKKVCGEPQILEALRNGFILIYHCEIYPIYKYAVYLREKGNVLEAAGFYVITFLISIYYFHRFSYSQVTVDLDPTVVLVCNGDIVEKSS